MSFWAESAKTLGFAKRELLAEGLSKGLYKGICFQIWTPDLEHYGRLAGGGAGPPNLLVRNTQFLGCKTDGI